ncbi:MAG TPA: 2Fe-2S iron-sulfur cluster binding domain-containing protein [Kofleriaceae bacterium]|jgi:propane monooxygenase reductase subunit|nr:2Fe-2S iron-sulfur cluster binding domain-containing protein [Kofleriaceae bacterium]
MSVVLRLQPFDRDLECEAGETVLDAVLRGGLQVPFGCRTGGCGTCRMRLVEGEVDDGGGALALTPEERAAGWFLPCVTRILTGGVVDAGDLELREHVGPRAHATEVVRNERVTPEIHALRLRVLDPDGLQFTAGQFVNVEIPGGTDTRSYSIASAPSRPGELDLYVKRRDGRFSGLLDGRLAPGAPLRLFGPFGQLRIRLSHRPIVMIASGTGLAPLLSMLHDLADHGNQRPVRLVVQAGGAGELFALDELAAIAAAMPGFELVTVAAPTRTGALADTLIGAIGDARDHDAYLGGSRWSIEAALPVLLQLGVRRRNIYFDVFTPAVP